MLSPDERARVEQTAMRQIHILNADGSIRQVPLGRPVSDARLLPLLSPETLAALSKATIGLFNPPHAPEVAAIMEELRPTLAPWFTSSVGRPIWLTPADRAFLKVNRISDR